MLVTLLIIQALITLVLNQTYQAMMAQLQSEEYYLPIHPSHEIAACLKGKCSADVRDFRIELLATTPERQFFSPDSTLCQNGGCQQISQVFSEPSAILKDVRDYYAIKVIDSELYPSHH